MVFTPKVITLKESLFRSAKAEAAKANTEISLISGSISIYGLGEEWHQHKAQNQLIGYLGEAAVYQWLGREDEWLDTLKFRGSPEDLVHRNVPIDIKASCKGRSLVVNVGCANKPGNRIYMAVYVNPTNYREVEILGWVWKDELLQTPIVTRFGGKVLPPARYVHMVEEAKLHHLR